MARLKDEHQKDLLARDERKQCKKEARDNIRAAKRRDLVIKQQERSIYYISEMRQNVAMKRELFDSSFVHLQESHKQQRLNVVNSQDRNIRNEKILAEKECSDMLVT